MAASPQTLSGEVISRETARLRAVVGAVPDPEVPVLSIEDLGILRDVALGDDGRVSVTITPTYSGCPAMDTIRADVVAALAEHGYDDVDVSLVLSPAWTTDWMSEEGRRKLLEYGIAPPQGRPQHDPGGARGGGPVPLTLSLRCPQCGSPDTRELSRFGSTACKSLWVCNACREPFDHFKSL
jgi:ring-1,2-phenylacetyl-CoA epoxidase subunit PaaD